ncbi:MAG: hypothetical protein QMD92_04420 [bacterium]|nr:hypothetical protein [bacterium]
MAERFTETPEILMVSQKLDPHVDIIATKLNEREIPFVRFNTEDFPLNVSASISFDADDQNQILNFSSGRKIVGSDIKGVWYRRPAHFKFPEEFSPFVKTFAEQESNATIRGLWEVLNCTWINHPESNRRAELKIKQLKTASEIGLEIPKTLITNSPEDAEKFFQKTKSKGVIIKRLGGGVMLDDNNGTAIYTSLIAEDNIKNVAQVKNTPVLLQEYVEKDVELRITIVGDTIFPVEIHSQKSEKAKTDWRKDTLNLKHKIHQLPKDVEKKLIKFMKKLDLNFGAVDMILTPKGKYVFLEINPNGQWGWIQDLTGLPISEEIINLLMKSPKK